MAQEAIIDGNKINDDRPLAVEVQNDVLAVDGPLTDDELRALAVNVLGPLTDAELRATPLEAEMQGDIGGGVLVTPEIDAATSAWAMVRYPHHKIHEGHTFTLSAYDLDLDNGETLAIAFTMPNTAIWGHPVVTPSNNVKTVFRILESPTITNGTGSDLVPYNRNRNSANTSGILSIKAVPVANQATLNPTITDDGTAIFSQAWGGDKKGSGPALGVRDEWMAGAGLTYAFEIESQADNGVASISVTWYEHENEA